jgi:hypothetical protein
MMSNPWEGYLPDAHEEFSLGYLQDDDEDYWQELEMHFLRLMEAARGQRKIKWKHSRLNWNEHVEKLLHEEEFDATYRMSHEAFTTLLDFLRPMITPNLIKARDSCDEPIYPEIVMAVGWGYLPTVEPLQKTNQAMHKSQVDKGTQEGCRNPSKTPAYFILGLTRIESHCHLC